MYNAAPSSFNSKSYNSYTPDKDATLSTHGTCFNNNFSIDLKNPKFIILNNKLVKDEIKNNTIELKITQYDPPLEYTCELNSTKLDKIFSLSHLEAIIRLKDILNTNESDEDIKKLLKDENNIINDEEQFTIIKEISKFKKFTIMSLKRAMDWGQVEHCLKYNHIFASCNWLACLYAHFRGCAYIFWTVKKGDGFFMYQEKNLDTQCLLYQNLETCKITKEKGQQIPPHETKDICEMLFKTI